MNGENLILRLTAACSLYKRFAVSTFGNGGVILVSAYADTVEGTIVLGHHIMLAL